MSSWLAWLDILAHLNQSWGVLSLPACSIAMLGVYNAVHPAVGTQSNWLVEGQGLNQYHSSARSGPSRCTQICLSGPVREHMLSTPTQVVVLCASAWDWHAGCVETMAEDRTLLLAGWTLHRPPSLPMRLPALLLLVALAPRPAAAWSAAAHGGALYALTTLLPTPALPPAQVCQLEFILIVEVSSPEALHALLHYELLSASPRALLVFWWCLNIPWCPTPPAPLQAAGCTGLSMLAAGTGQQPMSQFLRPSARGILRVCSHSVPL